MLPELDEGVKKELQAIVAEIVKEVVDRMMSEDPEFRAMVEEAKHGADHSRN